MRHILLALAIILPLAAQAAEAGFNQRNGPATANASLINLRGQPIGTAQLSQLPDGTHIRLDATDLPPGHIAFTIHQTGACDPSTGFQSAGGNFTPTTAPNITTLTVKQDGTLHTEVINPAVTLDNTRTGLGDLDGAALVMRTAAQGSNYSVACGVVLSGK